MMTRTTLCCLLLIATWSCAAPQSSTPPAEVHLLTMKEGDIVKVHISSSGCFSGTTHEVVVENLQERVLWRVDVERASGTSQLFKPARKELELGLSSMMDLDRELRHARAKHSWRSTFQVDYTLEWTRGERTLASEAIHDRTGGFPSVERLKFASLLEEADS